MVMISQVYAYLQTHQVMHIKYAHHFVCQSYFHQCLKEQKNTPLRILKAITTHWLIHMTTDSSLELGTSPAIQTRESEYFLGLRTSGTVSRAVQEHKAAPTPSNHPSDLRGNPHNMAPPPGNVPTLSPQPPSLDPTTPPAAALLPVRSRTMRLSAGPQ